MHFSYLQGSYYTTYLVLLDFMTLKIFGEAYNLRSSSLCSLFQHPATFSLLSVNILLSTLCSVV